MVEDPYGGALVASGTPYLAQAPFEHLGSGQVMQGKNAADQIHPWGQLTAKVRHIADAQLNPWEQSGAPQHVVPDGNHFLRYIEANHGEIRSTAGYIRDKPTRPGAQVYDRAPMGRKAMDISGVEVINRQQGALIRALGVKGPDTFGVAHVGGRLGNPHQRGAAGRSDVGQTPGDAVFR